MLKYREAARAFSYVAALTLVAGSSAAWAQPVSKSVEPSAGMERMPMSAFKPMERRLTKLRKVNLAPFDEKTTVSKPPAVMGGDNGAAAVAATAALPRDAAIAPENYGSGGLLTINHYSDKLINGTNLYPYRQTGWLTFINYAGQSYRCTASLISKSIAVTAGHCVHKGGGGAPYWNKSAVYTPAFANGAAPYGSAPAIQFWTTGNWFGTGALDRGYDVGLVVLGKRTGTAVEIGNYTGWYGFCLSGCLQRYWSNTQLGYPGNYYSGLYMTEGQHIEYSDGYDFRSGSGMQGGSSGGPHIANHGSLSDSTTNLGQWTFRNIVMAVTSWGYTDPQYKIQGYSTLSGPGNTNNFKAMFNGACTTARAVHGVASCNLLP